MGATEQPEKDSTEAARDHVTDAHKNLQDLREKLGHHPELDEAIMKLELALSALTIQTGGLL